jgi:protein tyrosine/serine phosphatase
MSMTMRLALLVGALLAAPGCGGGDDKTRLTSTTTQKPFAQRVAGVNGLENFARVNTNLYRGAQPTEEGFKHLKSMGVKTVVGLRSNHSTKKAVEAAGLVSIELPLKADLESVPPTDPEIKKFMDVVLDPLLQPVYFHCAFGKDRTGTMCAIYRMEMDGWTSDEALQEMDSFGYHTYYKDFAQFIRDYKPRGFGKGK